MNPVEVVRAFDAAWDAEEFLRATRFLHRGLVAYIAGCVQAGSSAHASEVDAVVSYMRAHDFRILVRDWAEKLEAMYPQYSDQLRVRCEATRHRGFGPITPVGYVVVDELAYVVCQAAKWPAPSGDGSDEAAKYEVRDPVWVLRREHGEWRIVSDNVGWGYSAGPGPLEVEIDGKRRGLMPTHSCLYDE